MISLVADCGSLRGKVQAGVLVKPLRKDIMRVAKNKLRLSSKVMRSVDLYLQTRVQGSLVRTLVVGASDLSTEVKQGSVIVVAPSDVTKPVTAAVKDGAACSTRKRVAALEKGVELVRTLSAQARMDAHRAWAGASAQGAEAGPS